MTQTSKAIPMKASEMHTKAEQYKALCSEIHLCCTMKRIYELREAVDAFEEQWAYKDYSLWLFTVSIKDKALNDFVTQLRHRLHWRCKEIHYGDYETHG